MKKTIISVILIFFIVFFSAIFILENKNFDDGEKIIEEVLEDIEEDEVEEIIEGIEESYTSPLSGLEINEELLNRRIIGIMFDDHPRARWQSGLSYAEIVYEMPVESPYTRYLAFYLISKPESLGPIRSSRPYFVTKVLEYNSVYVRVGGSEQAKADIINYKIDDIDALISPSTLFYRGRHKRAPNNLYTSMDKVLEEINRKNFDQIEHKEIFLFNKEDEYLNGFKAENIFIDYKGGNTSEYFYDEEKRVYNRKKDHEIHVDEINQLKIEIKNIIIQYTNIRTIDGEGRKNIELTGEGRAKYFTNGVGKDIIWKKDKRNSITKYYDLKGEEILLNKGNTWINIVDNNMDIKID